MPHVSLPAQLRTGGIEFHVPEHQLGAARHKALAYLDEVGVANYIVVTHERGPKGALIRFRLSTAFAHDWAPQHDTTQLCKTLSLDTHIRPDHLDLEILLAMLVSPVAFPYPSIDELRSAVRIRHNIVENARRTALAFDTEAAERPEEFWQYSEETGFVLIPGKPLVEALVAATQPAHSGKLYSFSCYRATEYVMLLSIAQEAARSNPTLLGQLQRQWETRAIMSGKFHEVFLREYGSTKAPLPPRFYVPGDRLWFRNPDPTSSNVEGYEGSWVMYLGAGLFTNFWKRDQPFTLASKCVELYHWRHATYVSDNGKLRVDDSVVDQRVAQSMADEHEVARIVQEMERLRDPAGVYANGGCIDRTRECARYVRPATTDIRLREGNRRRRPFV
ncbi:hypothetical protein GSY71_00820 [Pusillimonas sp. TS35]|uniref:hypothetical protein n=1 Tax=Paracandidimonas lactea TaxID=2895524 RepID=UPI00136C3DB0|nr:hypothetical protein [Paracandidimonas lactea]MYN11699.1 hypothetical protein [Pusillimonas sp. TS35]